MNPECSRRMYNIKRDAVEEMLRSRDVVRHEFRRLETEQERRTEFYYRSTNESLHGSRVFDDCEVHRSRTIRREIPCSIMRPWPKWPTVLHIGMQLLVF